MAITSSRPSRGDPAPGRTLRQLPCSFAVHLGLRRIAEPQFDPGADLIFQRRPDLSPPRCCDDDVDAVRKPLGGKRGDRCLQRVELLANGRPTRR